MDIEMTGPAREQSRARYPDSSGYTKRDGVRLYYEVYGSGGPTVFLLPTWSIIHSRHWKMQIPYLARHCRVITFDGRGNGRSDRPAAGYGEEEFAADALAVMDATATERAVIVSLSVGAQRALIMAAGHPDRVAGAVFICPAVPLASPVEDRTRYPWDEVLPTDEGWAKDNLYYWLRDYRGFLEFFFSQMFTEPHSTKPIEDCIGWGLETTAETLVATEIGNGLDEAAARELCSRVRCPVLVVQGTADAITGLGRGVALAAATGGELVLLEGSGHGPHVRDPVKVNLLLRDFAVPRGHARAGHVARPAPSVRCTSPHRSAWATPSGMWRSPASCASCTRAWRSTGSPSIRSPGCWRRAGSGFTRPAHTWPMSPGTSSPSRPGTTCTASRPSGGWMRFCWPTSWSSTTWPPARTTTCGSAMRPGSSTTTCTRTPSRSTPPTPG